ncbi:MAG: Fe-S cluster assembly protein SufD [Crocinitomicaceae bacterium]|nr:Fe-S cluster assembly protein SufD [Crocinitomicaceae bacterium]
MNTDIEMNISMLEGLTPTSILLDEKELSLAQNTLATNQLPTTRMEAWKYTRVAKLGKTNYRSSEETIESLDAYRIAADATTFVFVNGHFSEELSSDEMPEGVSISPLSSCMEGEINSGNLVLEDEIFTALNTAFLTDGVLIDIEAKAIIEKPIQIIHLLKGEAALSNFKTIINAGDFSKAGIIQGFFAEDANKAFANVTSEISVGKNAFLTIDKIQYEAENTSHISTEQVSQEKDSTFTINTITLNGGLVRNNLNIEVIGENCETNLNGTYLLKGKQHVDNHTVVDHTVPNCNSNELYKGVIDDQATAVFNGKVFVRRDAQKINAFQSNGNVLMSDNATVNSKPELEIYADDVKCSHGSTTGQLDEEAVFYLRARGLSEKSARKLMVSAFIGDALDKIENKDVLKYTYKLLKERFAWDFESDFNS